MDTFTKGYYKGIALYRQGRHGAVDLVIDRLERIAEIFPMGTEMPAEIQSIFDYAKGIVMGWARMDTLEAIASWN